jgi:hypothetical protein
MGIIEGNVTTQNFYDFRFDCSSLVSLDNKAFIKYRASPTSNIFSFLTVTRITDDFEIQYGGSYIVY